MHKKRTNIFNNISYIDLYPIQFGYETCSPSHAKPLAKQNNYLLHYIIDGSGEFRNIDTNERVYLTQGQGFLISPDQVTSYQADLYEPWTYYWVEFNGVKAWNYLRKMGFSRNKSTYQTQEGYALDNFINLFEQLLDTNREEETIGTLFLLMDRLIQGSSDFVSIQNDDLNHNQNFYIKESIKFITRNYQNNISIKDIADHCKLSRTYLTKLFKAELETTPSAYLSQYRMNKALELLKDPNQSIGSISDQIGYSNQFVFSNAFKKEFGMSPSQWRNLESH